MSALLRKLRLLKTYRSRNLWRLLYGSKWVASGALIFDEDGHILLIHHRWRQAWEYPMGMTDGEESPLQTAIREVAEEVGLHPDPATFVLAGIDFFHRRTPNGNLTFTFTATVTPAQVARLKLEALEVTDHRWVTRDAAYALISDRLKHRLRALLKAYDDGRPVYLESREQDSE